VLNFDITGYYRQFKPAVTGGAVDMVSNFQADSLTPGAGQFGFSHSPSPQDRTNLCLCMLGMEFYHTHQK
jgi:hypothetical protein